jgi:hypothetical protein
VGKITPNLLAQPFFVEVIADSARSHQSAICFDAIYSAEPSRFADVDRSLLITGCSTMHSIDVWPSNVI